MHNRLNKSLKELEVGTEIVSTSEINEEADNSMFSFVFNEMSI
jgi:hypothetical protein